MVIGHTGENRYLRVYEWDVRRSFRAGTCGGRERGKIELLRVCNESVIAIFDGAKMTAIASSQVPARHGRGGGPEKEHFHPPKDDALVD